MIYFDNAATTKYKPNKVYDAINYYLREIGVSPGRGSYSLGIEASRMLYQSRCTVGDFFGLTRPEQVVFTKNSTEAINLFLQGYLKKNDHVVISCYEHNAILRPLHKMKEQGIIDYSVISREDLELTPQEIYVKYAQDNTRLLALTLASNLTGRKIWKAQITEVFHSNGITTFLDSSQGAGKIQINMEKTGIDVLAFTGHKDLMAIPGVGGLCLQKMIKINPLIQGGTGIHGEYLVNPDVFPEGFEAGTLNMPAIWSLKTSIDYISHNRMNISNKESELMTYLMSSLQTLDNIIVYDCEYERIPTCSINVRNVPSDKIVSILDRAGICSRGGIHCAILAHKALGTVETGTVRISLSYKNTKLEIDELIKVLREVGE